MGTQGGSDVVCAGKGECQCCWPGTDLSRLCNTVSLCDERKESSRVQEGVGSVASDQVNNLFKALHHSVSEHAPTKPAHDRPDPP